MKTKFKIRLKFLIFIVIPILFVSSFVGTYLLYYFDIIPASNYFLSPFIGNPRIISSKIPSNKPIYAFLPYWNIDKADIQYHLIDYLIYFGVSLDYKGNIIKFDEDRNSEMGWYKLNSPQINKIRNISKKSDVKFGIAITVFNNQAIDTLLKSETSKQNSINNILNLIERYDLEAINIDYEYDANKEITANQMQLALYLQDLKSQLKKKYPNVNLSIDLYANSYIKDYPYNAKLISENVDNSILMGYDFYRSNSKIAGPVSPIKVRNPNNPSIIKALKSADNKGINLNTIILAMPFYGYEWSTYSEDYQSTTTNIGATASYKRIKDIVNNNDVKFMWDEYAMSPWLIYKKDNTIKQIYYDDDRSIGYKLQLIDKTNLAGGAFWALGYEGKNANIWKIIEAWRIGNKLE